MATPIYRLFGLNVSCDLPLDNAPFAERGEVDVVVRSAGIASVPEVVPSGAMLSELRGRRQELAACTTRDDRGRVILRLPGHAEFVLDIDHKAITYVRDPQVEPSFVAILITGMCLATYLQICGHGILHASAVHTAERGGVVAFVGQSGMGKSTMATIMNQSGLPLVADDILRVSFEEAVARCFRGTIETRLRPRAASLVNMSSDEVRPTNDERLAVRLPYFGEDSAPLRALIVPGPDPEARHVELSLVTGAKALFTLLAYPRLLNWHDPLAPAGQMEFLTELVGRVPVFISRLPWGPPFPPDLATALLEALRRSLK